MELHGKAIAPGKNYKVAGWASVQEDPAGTRPIWDVVAEYLRDVKHVRAKQLNAPRILSVTNNPGIAAI
jgi:sulfur-oxidizing protein SoxB